MNPLLHIRDLWYSNSMKTCPACKIEKDIANFYKHKRTKDGLSSSCKSCHSQRTKAYYEKNSIKLSKLNAQAALRNQYKLRIFINSLKDKPCADCGHVFPPCAMDFDHIDPTSKTHNVSHLAASGSIETILEEVAKCELVCACCHRIRTEERKHGRS